MSFRGCVSPVLPNYHLPTLEEFGLNDVTYNEGGEIWKGGETEALKRFYLLKEKVIKTVIFSFIYMCLKFKISLTYTSLLVLHQVYCGPVPDAYALAALLFSICSLPPPPLPTDYCHSLFSLCETSQDCSVNIEF